MDRASIEEMNQWIRDKYHEPDCITVTEEGSDQINLRTNIYGISYNLVTEFAIRFVLKIIDFSTDTNGSWPDAPTSNLDIHFTRCEID